jgi:hypothetical protein
MNEKQVNTNPEIAAKLRKGEVQGVGLSEGERNAVERFCSAKNFGNLYASDVPVVQDVLRRLSTPPASGERESDGARMLLAMGYILTKSGWLWPHDRLSPHLFAQISRKDKESKP